MLVCLFANSYNYVSLCTTIDLVCNNNNNNNIRLISQDKPLDHNTSLYIHICHAGQLDV